MGSFNLIIYFQNSLLHDAAAAAAATTAAAAETKIADLTQLIENAIGYYGSGSVQAKAALLIKVYNKLLYELE